MTPMAYAGFNKSLNQEHNQNDRIVSDYYWLMVTQVMSI